MAQTRRKKTARRKPRRRAKKGSSGVSWMLFGLAVGLAVAAAVYVYDRRGPAMVTPAARTPAPAPRVEIQKTEPGETSEEDGLSLDFYDMLPSFEVVIPEQDLDPRPSAPPQPVQQPGAYVLQAGSFSAWDDADRRKAQIAMLGISSRIQRVTVDDKTYHRVRIGPVEDLKRLEDYRSRLREAQIDALIIRMPVQ